MALQQQHDARRNILILIESAARRRAQRLKLRGIPNCGHLELGAQSGRKKTNRLVGLSVTLVSPAKTAERIEMPFGLRTRVGPRNHVLDGVQMPHGKRQFWGETGRPVVKYRGILRWAVQKWLNQSRYRLDCGIGWVQKSRTGWIMEVQISQLEGAILRGKGRLNVKYGDALACAVQKRLNRSSCRLGCGLGRAKGSIYYMGPNPPCEGAIIRRKDMPGHARRHAPMSSAK